MVFFTVFTMCLLADLRKADHMAVSRLTKRTVDAAEVRQKPYMIWDVDLKGFGLKVTPTGRKVYLIQYRSGKRSRRVTFGIHGTLTTEEARQQARVNLGHVAFGDDPAAERDKSRTALSVDSVFLKFEESHLAMHVKPETAKDYRRVFKTYIIPHFRHVSVRDISKQDVLRLHHDMRMTPYRANRTIAKISKFCNWCEEHGYRGEHTNPCRFVKKYKEEPRHRYLSTDEQKRLGEALTEAEIKGVASPYAVNAIRLLSLTGARLREITHLKWAYVNFERGTLDLPDSKTGRKTIYLNAAAKDILASIVRQADNPFVICGDVEGRPLINLQKPWSRIRAMAGLEDVRMHDLRHTFASVAAMGGMSLQMIGALLGHSQPQTTARYAHLAANPLLEAAEEVGRKISATQ